MEIETAHALTSTMPLMPAEPPATEALPAVAVSPWEEFLIGRVSADRFLTRMGRDVITMPDDATRHHFAEALAAQPGRISRLIELLQAADLSGDTIRRIVVELAEAGIKHLGVVSFPEPLDVTAFRQAVASWLAGIRKPVKQADLNILFLLLQFGRHRQCLDDYTAFSLVASACCRSGKPGQKHAQPKQPAGTALEVLLTAGPTPPVISSFLAYDKVHTATIDQLTAQIHGQAADIVRLNAECASLNTTMTGLRTDIAMLREAKATAESRVAELERQIVDIRDGYRHQIYEMHERARGVLQGQLTRWLQTALDATRANPPKAAVIEERVEDALKLIAKEIQWLQPSA